MLFSVPRLLRYFSEGQNLEGLKATWVNIVLGCILFATPIGMGFKPSQTFSLLLALPFKRSGTVVLHIIIFCFAWLLPRPWVKWDGFSPEWQGFGFSPPNNLSWDAAVTLVLALFISLYELCKFHFFTMGKMKKKVSPKKFKSGSWTLKLKVSNGISCYDMQIILQGLRADMPSPRNWDKRPAEHAHEDWQVVTMEFSSRKERATAADVLHRCDLGWGADGQNGGVKRPLLPDPEWRGKVVGTKEHFGFIKSFEHGEKDTYFKQIDVKEGGPAQVGHEVVYQLVERNDKRIAQKIRVVPVTGRADRDTPRHRD